METKQVIVLPPEVNELAVKVSDKKQEEVRSVLNQIFAGTSDWERQVDAIEVKGIEDKMSIQLADVARKNVKAARLNAEKLFDAKREEVQQIKAEFDLEDKLWLKAKQVMQLKFKAIEEKAEWKAQFVERYVREQKELKTQLRIEQVSKFNPEINRIQFENMNDEMFNIFIAGLERAENDRIEAERKAEEERQAAIKAAEEERQRMIAENARLQKEAEAREKAMEEERKIQAAKLAEEQAKAKKEAEKAEAERKAVEEKARKEREESERILQAEIKTAAEKLAKEQEAARKIAAELQAKKDAEMKAQREAEAKAEADRKAKEIADKKAAAAPDKQKLLSSMDSMTMPQIDCKTAWGQLTEKVIRERFEGFKEWAKKEINKEQNTLNL